MITESSLRSSWSSSHKRSTELLRLELYLVAALPQLTVAKVKLKRAEANRVWLGTLRGQTNSARAVRGSVIRLSC
jgi:hypothetical protein